MFEREREGGREGERETKMDIETEMWTEEVNRIVGLCVCLPIFR